MAPTKKKCCIQHCDTLEEINGKQFFKVGSNIEEREKWLCRIGRKSLSKTSVLYCCEDHFDLPNDAENYIRYKYVSGTKLKLRSNILPYKKIPTKVCRICLKIIFIDDQFIDISDKSSQTVQDTLKVCLPEIGLNITSDSVACINCFNSLESFYKTKQKALKAEVAVVKCVKSVLNKAPGKISNNCMDLLENYSELQNILNDEPSVENEEKETCKEIKIEDKNDISTTIDSTFQSHFHTLTPVTTTNTNHSIPDSNSTIQMITSTSEIINPTTEIITVIDQAEHNPIESMPFEQSQGGDIYMQTPASTIIVQPTSSSDGQMPVYNIIYTTDGSEQDIHQFHTT